MGLNKTWQISQLFYTGAVLRLRQPGELRHRSDKKSNKGLRAGERVSGESGVAGCVWKTSLRLSPVFCVVYRMQNLHTISYLVLPNSHDLAACIGLFRIVN